MHPVDRDAKIYVAGHRGLVGSATVRKLESAGFANIIVQDRTTLDLRDRDRVDEFLRASQPDFVIAAAAKVGGILANQHYPADFIFENLMIQTNLIDASYRAGVRKFVFLGSTCIYPKMAPQPLKEDYLLSGPLEPSNQSYAVAKIAGIEMCQAYSRQHGFGATCLMPTNLYGPNDNFDLETSHVLPAIIRKAHEAKMAGQRSITIWGTGTPLREFLHVDDLADAIVFCLGRASDGQILNVGAGEEISVGALARLTCDVVGFEGEAVFDISKPDGTPRKLADISRMEALGWKPTIGLREGIEQTYRWFLNNVARG